MMMIPTTNLVALFFFLSIHEGTQTGANDVDSDDICVLDPITNETSVDDTLLEPLSEMFDVCDQSYCVCTVVNGKCPWDLDDAPGDDAFSEVQRELTIIDPNTETVTKFCEGEGKESSDYADHGCTLGYIRTNCGYFLFVQGCLSGEEDYFSDMNDVNACPTKWANIPPGPGSTSGSADSRTLLAGSKFSLLLVFLTMSLTGTGSTFF